MTARFLEETFSLVSTSRSAVHKSELKTLGAMGSARCQGLLSEPRRRDQRRMLHAGGRSMGREGRGCLLENSTALLVSPDTVLSRCGAGISYLSQSLS